MATTIDRPTRQPPQPKRKPRKPPPKPGSNGRPAPPPRPTGWAERLLAPIYVVTALAAVLLGVLVAAAIGLAVVLSLGSGEVPPATGAAELVPANALLYLHVSTDTSRPAVGRALALGRRLPGSSALLAPLTGRIDAILGGSSGRPVNFATDVRPWLGREAALAVLDTPGASAGSLIVLDVRNRVLARRFLATVGARPDGAFRGVRLLSQPSGTALAFVRHYLVLGQAASVEDAIYIAERRAPSLAATVQYQRAAAGEPAGRVLDAYAPADGIRRALEPRSGLLGDLGALLDAPPLSAAAISVSAQGRNLSIDVHRTFVPKLVRLTGDRPVQFTPSLAGALPAGSTLLLDVHGLRASVPGLLALAARVGVAGKIAPLLSRLGGALASEGVDLRQILSIFSGETAIGIVPGTAGRGPAPVIVTRPTREALARAELAGLEAPLTQVFAPPSSGPGQVPEIADTVVAGVPVHELSLAPGFGLDYAVARGLVAVSTAPAGIAAVFGHHRPLAEAPSFQHTLADHPSRVTSLLFFDLSQLLRLGEQTGLIGAPRQAALSPAVEKIRAVSLVSWRGAYDTTTELQLQMP